jgi:hypothetical protein
LRPCRGHELQRFETGGASSQNWAAIYLCVPCVKSSEISQTANHSVSGQKCVPFGQHSADNAVFGWALLASGLYSSRSKQAVIRPTEARKISRSSEASFLQDKAAASGRRLGPFFLAATYQASPQTRLISACLALNINAQIPSTPFRVMTIMLAISNAT